MRSANGKTAPSAFLHKQLDITAHLDAFDIRKAKVDSLAPMIMEKAGELAEKLTITLTYPKDDIKNVTLKIAWGNLALSAPVKVDLAE